MSGRFLTAALAAGCALVVGMTLLFHGLTASSEAATLQALQSSPGSPPLRFGSDQTPLPLVYAPSAQAPLAPAPAPGSTYRFIWPADYRLVQGMWAGHRLGIDIGTPPGEPVKSVRDGRVAFAGGDPCCNYGLFVIVEHDEGWSSVYAHFSRIDVKFGDVVHQGQSLGLSGATGHVSGPHIHFELRHNGGVVNPLDYLEPRVAWQPTAELIAELRRTAQDVPPNLKGSSPSGPAVAAAAEAPARLDASTAMLLGANWMAHQEQSAYEIDAMSCTAVQSGPNWWVTCTGRVQGCRGATCSAQLSSCVFDQPRLVAAACP